MNFYVALLTAKTKIFYKGRELFQENNHPLRSFYIFCGFSSDDKIFSLKHAANCCRDTCLCNKELAVFTELPLNNY